MSETPKPFAEVRPFDTHLGAPLYGLFVGAALIDQDTAPDQPAEPNDERIGSLIDVARRLNAAVAQREAKLREEMDRMRAERQHFQTLVDRALEMGAPLEPVQPELLELAERLGFRKPAPLPEPKTLDLEGLKPVAVRLMMGRPYLFNVHVTTVDTGMDLLDVSNFDSDGPEWIAGPRPAMRVRIVLEGVRLPDDEL